MGFQIFEDGEKEQSKLNIVQYLCLRIPSKQDNYEDVSQLSSHCPLSPSRTSPHIPYCRIFPGKKKHSKNMGLSRNKIWVMSKNIGKTSLRYIYTCLRVRGACFLRMSRTAWTLWSFSFGFWHWWSLLPISCFSRTHANKRLLAEIKVGEIKKREKIWISQENRDKDSVLVFFFTQPPFQTATWKKCWFF